MATKLTRYVKKEKQTSNLKEAILIKGTSVDQKQSLINGGNRSEYAQPVEIMQINQTAIQATRR